PPDLAWQSVIAELGRRTEALFAEGRDVCDAVRGRLRYELRATWLGGATVLSRTLEVRQRSLHARPVLRRLDLATILLRSAWW
ncbi:MAG TPA: hypothetical protein VMF13_23090, partial [Luteitalea sp.]|nr:hypothetical protein [Luteitalea sp.]